MAASASQALQDFNNSISQYGNIEDSVNSYVSQKKNEIYDNWKSGLLNKLNMDNFDTQEKKQQFDELVGLSGATLASVQGAYKKYKSYQAKKSAGGETTDDMPGNKSTGTEEGGDLEGASDVAKTTTTDTADTADVADTSVADTADVAKSVGSSDIEMTPIGFRASAEADAVSEPATSAVIGGGETAPEIDPAVLQTNPLTSSASEADVDASEAIKSSESAGKTTAENVGEDVAKNVGEDVGEDVAAETAGAGLLSGVGAAAGVALDVLGPVGMAAGLGLSIYDFFHHSHHTAADKAATTPPKAITNPYISTAFNTAGTLVLPSESSALDMIGGHSAF